MSTPSRRAMSRAWRIGADVEADDDAARGLGQGDVGFVDRADRGMQHTHLDVVVADLLDSGGALAGIARSIGRRDQQRHPPAPAPLPP